MNEIIFWASLYPSWYTRAIGCYQLAHWLRTHNIQCQVIDFCQWYTPEELVGLTIPFIDDKTKYIGISSSFWPDQLVPPNIIKSIEYIKREYPHIKILIGGPRANFPYIKKYADLIITGEAEDKILDLFAVSKKNEFNIVRLNHRFHHNDCIQENEPLPIELGRGCVFKCKFCGHHNLGKPKKTYQRDMDLVAEEMAYNYEMFKTKNYFFIDDTVNEDPYKVKLLSMLPGKLNIPISWVGYLRADLLWRYPETTEQLLTSGLTSCFFGIETLHKKASITIGKGWSGKYAREYLPILFNDIWKKQISIHNNFIIGLPEETLDDLKDTLAWCLNNPMGSHFFVAFGLYYPTVDYGPKSEFTRNYKKYGYELTEMPGGWKNSIMDITEALDIANSFNRKLYYKNRFTSWRLFDLLNIGFDLNLAKNKQLTFPSYEDKKNLFSPFLEKYVKSLKSIG